MELRFLNKPYVGCNSKYYVGLIRVLQFKNDNGEWQDVPEDKDDRAWEEANQDVKERNKELANIALVKWNNDSEERKTKSIKESKKRGWLWRKEK